MSYVLRSWNRFTRICLFDTSFLSWSLSQNLVLLQNISGITFTLLFSSFSLTPPLSLFYKLGPLWSKLDLFAASGPSLWYAVPSCLRITVLSVALSTASSLLKNGFLRLGLHWERCRIANNVSGVMPIKAYSTMQYLDNLKIRIITEILSLHLQSTVWHYLA